jgi:hypothetical protein
VQTALALPFKVNLYETQNRYYRTLARAYPQLKTAAEKGDANARAWTEEFREIGILLFVRVE